MDHRLNELFGIEHPILQAPMAGASTPALVAAVSNGGGLGSLGAAMMTPDDIRAAIREVRRLTDRPFNINLFAYTPADLDPVRVAKMRERLAPYYAAAGAEVPDVPVPKSNFDAQFAVVLDERVPVFSFTFGMPPSQLIAAAQQNGTTVVGTATTVAEAQALQAAGVDAVVAQGAEAGGHRGTFMGSFEDAMVGTMALVPQMVSAVSLPVIAAGGIMDGRGIVAALALGAAGAALGSAFLACPESGIHPAHRAALLKADETMTTVTRTLTGRPVRSLRNRLTAELTPHLDEIPPYPQQIPLARTLAAAAAKAGNYEFLPMLTGQGLRLMREEPAAALFAQLLRETEETRKRLSTNK
jgi:nitronate monooxygenase